MDMQALAAAAAAVAVKELVEASVRGEVAAGGSSGAGSAGRRRRGMPATVAAVAADPGKGSAATKLTGVLMVRFYQDQIIPMVIGH
ncbi:MAG: hypothetical protein U1E59_16370 [Amaricoccus sp.]